MKALLIMILLAAGIAQQAESQQFIERVYMKDSSFHEGYIIEQVPQQYLKVDRLKQKDTIIIPMTLIWKITKTYRTDTVALKPSAKPVKATKSRYLKTAFLELLGNAGVYSFNFDMRTEKGRRDRWGFRVGMEWIGLRARDTATKENVRIQVTGIPFALNYLVGKKKGFLELGMGATYFIARVNGQTLSSADIENYDLEIINFKGGAVIGTFNIGYRHVPYGSGITYRFALTPLVISKYIIPIIGMSIGYKF